MITVDGGTGSVILGAVDLVPARINDDLETILGWADDVRRLEVHANADTPADALKARELGARGDRPLPHRAHVLRRGAAPGRAGDDPRATTRPARRAALDRLLPFQQSDFEGIFEAMAGLPVTIRLLDPPLHEFLPSLEETTDERMRERIKALHEANPMLGTRGCRLGLQWPEIYEMQVRAIVRAALGGSRPHRRGAARRDHAPARRVRGGAAPAARAHDPRSPTAEGCDLPYLVGTMIELPRACVRADEIARHADFFSFGTNDLTQTALGFSRDDAEGKFLTRYLEDGVLAHDPFATLDQEGVGELMRIAVERGRSVERRAHDRHLRRARRRPGVGPLLPRARPRLRLLLAVSRARRPARGRAGGAGRDGRRQLHRRRRLIFTARAPRLCGAAQAPLAVSSSDVRGHRHEHALGELDEPVRVAPLVVVPGDDLHLGAVDHHRQRRVEDRRVRRPDDVGRDERLLAVAEDAQRARRGRRAARRAR